MVFLAALVILWAARLCVCLAEEYFSTLSFQMVGSLARGEESAKVLAKPGSGAIATIKKGESCQVVGHSGGYYQVIYRELTGYVKKTQLVLKGKETSAPLPEEKLSDLKMESYIPTRYHAQTIDVKGTICSSKEIDTLYFFLWDARKLQVEAAILVPLSNPSAAISTATLKKYLAVPKITAGRKVLVVEGSRDGEMTVLHRDVYAIRGEFAEVAHVTEKCTVSSKNVLTNNLKKTWQPVSDDSALTVKIPADVHARLMTLEWKMPPEAFTAEMYGESDELIEKETYTTGFYSDALTLTDAVRKVKLYAQGKDAELITLRVYPARYAEHAVQQWQPVPDKIDLMAVSAHQDDELLFLGGTVPYYCAAGKKVAMVYMTNGGRERYREALDGMWTCGLHYHPIFVNWHDAKVSSLSATENIWKNNYGGKDPRIKIVRLIRQYKPEVIVTQDFDGEYGHNQHRLTALLWSEAVTLSQDASYDTKSAQEYGVWEVKKLYIHLYKKNQITMDWEQPMDDGTGFTALTLAKEAFD
ncbi:MAG: PIG-L family deacetylase, partial [Clostridia bacterium]|nr:PIG-L family deacetylase [Clostridia bacterium]